MGCKAGKNGNWAGISLFSGRFNALFMFLFAFFVLVSSVSAASVFVKDSSENPVANALVEVYGATELNGVYSLDSSAFTDASGVASVGVNSNYVYLKVSKLGYKIAYPEEGTGTYAESADKDVVEAAALPESINMVLDVIPVIWTDKTDYRPEETVYIYGASLEVPSVHLKTTVLDTVVNEQDVAVVNGEFSTSFQLDGITDDYTVEASYNGVVLATTVFTDCPDTTCVNLAPIADSWVSANSNSNYGSDDELHVRWGSSNSDKRRAFLKFNLSSIPAAITSAKLRLYKSGGDSSSQTVRVNLVSNDSWTEFGITGNNQPAYSTLCGNKSVGSSDTYYDWNVTSCAQSEYSGDKIISLVARLNNSGEHKDFYSKERSGTSRDPYLEVCYEQYECDDDSDCSDGVYCNGAEYCDQNHMCQNGTSIDCSRLSNQCNNGVCDEGQDACVAQPKANGTCCDDGLYCTNPDTCSGGVCGGPARDCSGNNVGEVAMCTYIPDNFSSTFDYRTAFTSRCDEQMDMCTAGSDLISHTCADENLQDGGPNVSGLRSCSAECDGYGSECGAKMQGDYCYYSGRCNTDPTACACAYSQEYCPAPGTVVNGTCYYGEQSCTENGCGINEEGMECNNLCDPVKGPVDSIPPVVWNMSLTPNPAGPQCPANIIYATATENCTNIAGAEYYVHNAGYANACTPEGTLPRGNMSAVDGNYDEQVEDIKALLDVTGLLDSGNYKYCVRAKNADGYWSACECKRLEIDDMHPNLRNRTISNFHWADQYGYWICADDFNYTAFFCDQNDQSCIAAAEYFVKPPQSYDQPAGTGNPMLPADGAFSEPETVCDLAYDTVANGDYSEGTHEIKSEALDCACNWGKLIYQTPLKIVIDRTPPAVNKTILMKERIACDYIGDEQEAESCNFVTASTVIRLSAQDVDNAWDHVFSDDVTIHYRYRFKQNYNDSWGNWSDWVHVNAASTEFSFNEDSIHELEYYVTDRCGNPSAHHYEIDIVDSKPPVTVKGVGEPKVVCSEQDPNDCDYYITQQTPINFTCVDQQPHPVNDVTVYYRYNVDGGQFTEWMVYEGQFTFPQDSRHTLEYYCIDALGNKEQTQTEIDVVDTREPNLWKEVGDPKVECGEEGCDYYVNQSSVITIHCVDQQPHPVDNVTIGYYWVYCQNQSAGGRGVVNGESVSFTYPTDCCHELFYWCRDALGNEASDDEVDFVDSQPPVTTKTIEGPKVECDPQDPNGCDYYISQQSSIVLTCVDEEPHPVGADNIYYRYKVDDGQFTEWMEYEGAFSFPEDSKHTLEYYCVDRLGNKEQTQVEVDVVDSQPPVVSKELGEPKIACSQGQECDYWITQNTVVNFSCVDQQPHPVNDVKIYYRYEVDEEPEGKWILFEAPFSFQEDSVHYLEYYCEDALGNAGSVQYEVDKVDSTPPETVKTYGQPIVQVNGMEWITSATPVYLNASDGGRICAIGVNKTYWRNTLLYGEDENACYDPGACLNVLGSGDFHEYTGAFYKPETSCHLIEYYSVDYLGNAEQVKRQCVFVDNEAPNLTKTVGEPKVLCDPQDPTGCHYWVTQQTAIQLDCVDNGPHPVNQVQLWYRIKVDDGAWGEWIDPFEVDHVSGAHKTIYFTEDSVHTLQYYCVDALGNANGTREAPHEQVYRVDSVPPTTVKTYGQPIVERDGMEWITSATPVYLNASDGGRICAIGVNKTYWRNTLLEGEGQEACYYPEKYCDGMEGRGEWSEYLTPFYKNESSCHLIEYYSVDALGNAEQVKKQCVFVDNEAPETTKSVGQPSIACEDGSCHYWVTSVTPITLRCADVEPHPVDNVTLYYRYSVDGVNMTEWTVYEGPILFAEDSVHYLEYYCVDELGNTEIVKNETDKVDNTPPTTDKLLFGCYTPCTEEENCDYWINKTTKIRFNATDGGLVCAVGVDETKYKYKYDHFPWTNWMYYGGQNLSFHFEGYYYLKYYSVDELGNVEEVQDETDIVDNTPPKGWVQNPVSGRYYHDGETFTVMAPAADYGHPASGVADCEFSAIRIHFEDLSPQEILVVQHLMEDHNDLSDLLEFLGSDRYTLVTLGSVPYEDGYCKGKVTIPEGSGLNDKAYLVIRVSDRSCNQYYDLAREYVNGDVIIMDFDNDAPHVTITDYDGLSGTVDAGHHFIVYAAIEEYDSGADECWGELYQEVPVCHIEQVNETFENCTEIVEDGMHCENVTVTQNVTVCDNYTLEFIEHYAGTFPVDEYTCRVTGTIPGVEDGNYRLTVAARDEEFNIGSDSVRFSVDSQPPEKALYSPAEEEVYGPSGLPIKIGLKDVSGIAAETAQYRIYEPGVDIDATYSSGGLYDSGWRTTVLSEGNELDGNYTDVFNASAEGLESGTYFLRARGCDVLYVPPLPNGSGLPPHCSDPVRRITIDLTPPVGPTNVVIDGTTITWTAASDALSGVDHYNVYNSTDMVGETKNRAYTVNDSAATYWVSAVDKVGNEGAKVQAVAPTPPGGGGGSGGGTSGGGGAFGGGGGFGTPAASPTPSASPTVQANETPSPSPSPAASPSPSANPVQLTAPEVTPTAPGAITGLAFGALSGPLSLLLLLIIAALAYWYYQKKK